MGLTSLELKSTFQLLIKHRLHSFDVNHWQLGVRIEEKILFRTNDGEQ